jgi:UDP-N-acetyl-D-mannosaminuronic acid transferase (WecB/TagA/CpsF family)
LPDNAAILINVSEKTRASESFPCEKILGISFFKGEVLDAVLSLERQGGYLAIPAFPALIKLNYDQQYRRALQGADLVMPDSGLLTILWKLATGRKIPKISGLKYLTCLLGRDNMRRQGSALWVLPTDSARVKTIDLLRERGFEVGEENCYVAERGADSRGDYALLQEVESQRPQNIIIAVSGGAQEKLGLYLRDCLLYRPSIHCVGAALGFLTGDERPIPAWADRFYLGWFWRLLAQPRMVFPRLWVACELAAMIFKYRSELPPLRSHWADV